MLLALFESILVPILSEWVSDEDLCYLDTAYCNSSFRNMFLKLLSKCKISSIIELRKERSERVEWIVLRGLTLKSVNLFGKPNFSGLKLSRQFDFLCVNLNEYSRNCNIEYDAFGDLWMKDQAVAESFKELSFSAETVKVMGRLDKAHLEAILSVENIRVLDISNACPVPAETASVIVALGSNLVGVKFGHHQSIRIVDLVAGCPHLSVIEGCELIRCTDSPKGSPFGMHHVYGDLRRIDHASPTSVTIAGKQFEVFGVYSCQPMNDLLHFLPFVQYFQGHFHISYPSKPLRLYGNLLEFRVENESSDRLVEVIRQSPLLRVIVLNSCTLSDACMMTLAETCHDVEKLDVHCSVVSASSLIHVWNTCPRLDSMSMGGVNLCDGQPRETSRVVKVAVAVEIQSLVLNASYGCTLTRDHDRSLKRLTFTESVPLIPILKMNRCLLKFESHWPVDDGSIEVLVSSCPLLTSVGIDVCESFTLPALSSLKHLTSLTVRRLNELYPGDLNKLLSNKPYLRKLAFSYLNRFSDDLSVVGNHCPNIYSVGFSHCKSITDNDVVVLLRGCRELKSLNLEWCKSITSGILSTVVSRQLKYLNVHGCQIDEKGLCQLNVCSQDPESKFIRYYTYFLFL